jgi:hypothetical protein
MVGVHGGGFELVEAGPILRQDVLRGSRAEVRRRLAGRHQRFDKRTRRGAAGRRRPSRAPPRAAATLRPVSTSNRAGLDLHVDHRAARLQEPRRVLERRQPLVAKALRMPSPASRIASSAMCSRRSARGRWSCAAASHRGAGRRCRPSRASRRSRGSDIPAIARGGSRPGCSREPACRRPGGRRVRGTARAFMRVRILCARPRSR